MMRIAVVGGGPGGLYLAALAKQLDPAREVVMWERNAVDDTFGFGVVFSDETLDGLEQADPVLFASVSAEFARWSDIDVVHRGEVVTSGGHGFSAINRRVLLELLANRCTEVGVDLRFRTPAPAVEELRRDFDLVVAADGARSAIRDRYADVFGPDLDVRHARYIWLGLDRALDAFTFVAKPTPHGTLMVHAYPFSATRSTFIVEAAEPTWRALRFDAVDADTLPPGTNDEASIAALAELFRTEIDGAELVTNNSKWIRFTTVRNRCWHHGNLVLLGDAAHTAHFSIGSGTKLAMEDALALAAALQRHPEVPTALAAYETERRPVVESTQARGAGEPGVVRGRRPPHRTRRPAVLLQHAHPQPPRDLRQPGRARPGVRHRRPGALRDGCAAAVPAPAARRGAPAQPRRRRARDGGRRGRRRARRC